MFAAKLQIWGLRAPSATQVRSYNLLLWPIGTTCL